MADKRIFNLTEATTAGDNDLLALDNSNFPETRKIKVSKLRSGYVQKHDIAILDNLAGTTNTTGSTIRKDTYFYLDGILCVALADIAAGATFTFETNYDFATVGEELTDIKQTLSDNFILKPRVNITVQTDGVKTWKQILNTLASEFVSTARSLASNEYLTPLYLLNNAFYAICEHPLAVGNNANSVNIEFSTLRSYDNRTSMYFYVVSSTADNNTAVSSTIGSNGFTYNDATNTVPDSGKNITITCDIKKKL